MAQARRWRAKKKRPPGSYQSAAFEHYLRSERRCRHRWRDVAHPPAARYFLLGIYQTFAYVLYTPVATRIAPALDLHTVFISVRGEIISDHLSILHDEPNPFELGDIGYGVARNRDQISQFPRLDGTNLVLPPNHFRGIDSDGTDHIECCHSGSV